MSPKGIVLVAAVAAAGVLAAADVSAAPAGHASAMAGSGAAPGHRGSHRLSHPGGQRPGRGGHGHGGYHGHSNWEGHSNWGWGLGLGLAYGVPWALGWHDPFWWGSTYYAPYAYGPVYGSYGYACGLDDDCMRERLARSEPAPPTTEVAPAAPGEAGGPVQRPLHLNYCDSAGAWFPYVRTCPGGWRFVAPEFGAPR